MGCERGWRAVEKVGESVGFWWEKMFWRSPGERIGSEKEKEEGVRVGRSVRVLLRNESEKRLG